MFISPHHFQQLDRYHEGLLNFRLQSLVSFDWGLTALEIDKGALENRKFKLNRCSGILEDGLPVNVPETDEIPESRSLEEAFAVATDTLEVFLAAPIEHAGTPNCRLDEKGYHRKTRYAAKARLLPDENTGGKEREISCAKKNLTVLFSGESRDDFSYIKIAKLARTDKGEFELQENYVPPCLNVSASEHLMSILRDLRDRLAIKSRILSEKRREKITGVVEFSTFDVTTFWLLHTVNSYIPVLSHFISVGRAHPEQLYCLLAQLAGGLTTFAVDAHPLDLPKYLHEDLNSTFDALDARIRELLETVIPINCIPIHLARTPESWWVGRIDNDRLFDTTEFFLAVSAEMSERQLLKEIRHKIKIGTLDDIESLVNQSLPSPVAVSHYSRPPAAIPVKVGFQYFHLECDDAYWARIRGVKNLAFYVPDEFNGLKIELMAVKSNANEYLSREIIE
jgi:type VI secretion system protein ImpJ